MSNRLNISLTGATGHLGTALLTSLLDKGYKVRALFRNTPPLVDHSNITWVQGSLNDPSSIEALTEGTHTLIHAASLLSFESKDRELMYQTNVAHLETIIHSCIEKSIRLAYISSSTAVQRTDDTQIYSELLPYVKDTDFWYAWTKAEAEQVILGQGNNGLQFYIVRPTAIVGPPDHGPSRFGETLFDLYKGKLPFITEGGYNIIDIRDLSNTIVNSLELAKPGEIYLLGGQFANFSTLSSMLGRSKAPPKISLKALKAMLPLIQGIHRIMPLKWPVNKESLFTLEHAPEKMNLDKSIRELGHKNRPLQETLDDLVDWFESNQRKI